MLGVKHFRWAEVLFKVCLCLPLFFTFPGNCPNTALRAFSCFRSYSWEIWWSTVEASWLASNQEDKCLPHLSWPRFCLSWVYPRWSLCAQLLSVYLKLFFACNFHSTCHVSHFLFPLSLNKWSSDAMQSNLAGSEIFEAPHRSWEYSKHGISVGCQWCAYVPSNVQVHSSYPPVPYLSK